MTISYSSLILVGVDMLPPSQQVDWVPVGEQLERPLIKKVSSPPSAPDRAVRDWHIWWDTYRRIFGDSHFTHRIG